MWATFRGNVDIAAMLLNAGANVNDAGFLGTPLSQAAWADQTTTARLLIERGADPNLLGPFDGYAAVHWAASTERPDGTLLKLLLENGADPNLEGGENVDAFMGTPQTPLMLARRRGKTVVAEALLDSGATKAAPDRLAIPDEPARRITGPIDPAAIRAAITQAIAPLQQTSLESKRAFLRHESRQDCTSCHQQMLPMAAIGLARKQHIPVDTDAEQALIAMVHGGDLKDVEIDWQPLFHPEPVHSKGYSLLALAAQDVPADTTTDAWVHHLSVVQGRDGQWFNNLPRPPIQTDDVGATALAIHALQRYPLPGRRSKLAAQVARGRAWLWTAQPEHTEGRAYQILGLTWAGESPQKLARLIDALVAEQRSDGGWAQLPGLQSDPYATGQALFALHIAGQLDRSHTAIEGGVRFLLATQQDDGTWHVHRRAFPFQPTMKSGFPHGRDSWISAAGSSWAVMALSVLEDSAKMALKR
jgi:hypothetical protein